MMEIGHLERTHSISVIERTHSISVMMEVGHLYCKFGLFARNQLEAIDHEQAGAYEIVGGGDAHLC
jgi:hypothetical protein